MRILRQQKFMDWVLGFRPNRGRTTQACASDRADALGGHRDGPGRVNRQITILEIKSERISDRDKVRNVQRELDTPRKRGIGPSALRTSWMP